jgi:type IV pilus assembly protein PilV
MRDGREMRAGGAQEKIKGGHERSAAGGSPLALFRGSAASGGFTLIEVMIALFILVVALLGLISTTVVVVKANSFSKTMTTATTLAKDRLEQLKNASYTALAGGTDYATAGSTVQTSPSASSMFTRTWTVTADGTPATGMKTIQVTVQWNWQNASHNVDLRTIVAE